MKWVKWIAECERCGSRYLRNQKPIINIMTCCDLTMKWEEQE
jgi:hypothetical protein